MRSRSIIMLWQIDQQFPHLRQSANSDLRPHSIALDTGSVMVSA